MDTTVDSEEGGKAPTGEKPPPEVNAINLKDASLGDLLLYGLTLDDDDPALGVLLGVRRDLGLIVSLAEAVHPGLGFDLSEMAPSLEGMARRLDVACELLLRPRRVRAPEEPPASEAPPSSSTIIGSPGSSGAKR